MLLLNDLSDTARCYKNEMEIALGIKASNVPRHELFITSKVDTKEMASYDKTYQAVINALRNLQVSYLDLMLLHWPGIKGKPQNSPEHRLRRFEAYKALIRARDEGLVRFVGVSNFLSRHLGELFEDCEREGLVDYVPYLNQVELHPMCQQKETVQFCRERSINVQAYSSLGTGQVISKELSRIAN